MVKIHEVMTKDVLTIGPEAPLRDVAALLVEKGVSGLPVCDEQRRVVGVVSEGDILFKEQGEQPRSGGPLAWLVDATSYDSAVKAQARTAGETMSAPAVTIGPDRTVAEAARMMLEQGVNRLPVVKGDQLVGIVTRADLVRAFSRPDTEIAREIIDDVMRKTLWLEPAAVALAVSRGVVTLSGRLHGRSDAQLLERFVARVPGVIEVNADLTWEHDDTNRKTMKTVGTARL
jgi:CBS domain-containing protein